jgi:1-acyl-sn-glycerol-3-phosphate acyltransferase
MFYSLVKNTVGLYVRLVYRHKIYGVEHFPKGGGIIAGNHASYLDPPLISISCPGQVHFLARGSLFNFGPFGWLIRKLNTHPVTKGKENLGTIKLTVDLIMEGKKVLIFPEGTRSPDGHLRAGQAGVGMLVMRTKCQVIPVYVHGSYDIWGKGRRPRLWGKTACVFGTPLDFSKWDESVSKKEAQGKIVDEIMAKIAGLRDWYLWDRKGSPP